MKKLIILIIASLFSFSCSKENNVIDKKDLNSNSELRSTQVDNLLDCEDKGTPYASSYTCGKDYLIGIYNPGVSIQDSKIIADWHDSSYVNFKNGVIYLDSANYLPSANTTTDYVLTFNPSNKRVGKSLFPTTTTYTAGNGISIFSGVISKSKRQETYTGTTGTGGSLGVYTVTFATAYIVAPNIQVALQGDYPSYTAVVSSKSTTGFTVKVYGLTSILSLGLVPQYSAIASIPVDVIVTEK